MLGEDLDPGSEQTLEPLADSCDLGSLGPLRSAAAGPASGTWLRQALLHLRWKLWLRPTYYPSFPGTAPRFHRSLGRLLDQTHSGEDTRAHDAPHRAAFHRLPHGTEHCHRH